MYPDIFQGSEGLGTIPEGGERNKSEGWPISSFNCLKESLFTLCNAKQIKYCNWSCGKHDFKWSSDKDYRRHGLNQSQIIVFNQVEF